MSKVLCIYHGGCCDGFGSAVIVKNAMGSEEVEFFAGSYAFPPPDVSGRDVLLVDFSYKRPVLESMLAVCNSMTILDHHKTAKEDLSSIDSDKLTLVFDMERSGAGITWDYFMNPTQRPLFVQYLEDRDLWKKQLPGGDEFTIALRSYPQEFEVWERYLFSDDNCKFLIQEGAGIQRYYRLRVEELKKTAYQAQIYGYQCYVTNAPYFAASEVAGELAILPGAKFGVSYFEVSPGRYQYSLRSKGDFDVSEVAKMFGGGGHKNAAGISNSPKIHHADSWSV